MVDKMTKSMNGKQVFRNYSNPLTKLPLTVNDSTQKNVQPVNDRFGIRLLSMGGLQS